MLIFAPADCRSVLYCGSFKSLVSGVPMARVLFPSAEIGAMILPIMIYHQMQLMVSATLAPAPLPLFAGFVQTHLILSLTPGVTYYFAIRARDEVNNWSAISNVIQVGTTATDTHAPAAVQDLTITP